MLRDLSAATPALSTSVAAASWEIYEENILYTEGFHDSE